MEHGTCSIEMTKQVYKVISYPTLQTKNLTSSSGECQTFKV
jgi:hypothetical protein